MKYLLILFLFITAGCNGPINSLPYQTKGRITDVLKFRDATVIWVEFYDKDSLEDYKVQFYASDTCKIGQIITLK